MEEQDELVDQIKYLFEEKDLESIKYILGGENAASVEKICAKLPEEMATSLRTMFQELPKESEDQLQSEDVEENGRNKRIDEHLQRLEQEERNESFLEMLAKANEKLIYEEHFGFPFYDLIKRVLITHGDSKPQVSTIKAVHSQVAILYGVLFSQAVMKWLTEDYENIAVGFKEYLPSIFPRLAQKYFQFHQVYKSIKKEAAQHQQLDADDDGAALQMSVQDDETLDIDEKQFLMTISEAADDFQTFQKNRNYNFMVFGMRKYLSYVGLDPNVFGQAKEREFCELLSFLSIRFIRRMIFTIIRDRNNNVLRVLSQPITPQQVRRIGNQLVDEIAIQVADHLKSVVATTDAQAEAIFLQQFQPYAYSDFIPRKTLNAVLQKGETRAQYAWRTHKQYKHIWGQRVKVDYYFKHGGVKPVNRYMEYAVNHRRVQSLFPGKTWKNFLMIEFGFVGVGMGGLQKPTKKQKLDSCQD